MPLKPIIDEISTDIADILGTKFVYSSTDDVPSDSDAGLSYERGEEKKGKEIETCVLYVDIRGSVEMSKTKGSVKMGKIYTSFVKSVIKVARYHDGHTRNIIGDRVMVVFPRKNCFTNAVSCAMSINHVAHKVIQTKLGDQNFKCGIGIDHGIMRVIKVGVPRRGQEANANRGLVWAGEPANIASRLTDRANKKISEPVYDVIYNPINNKAIKPLGWDAMPPLQRAFSGYDPNASFYHSYTVKNTLSENHFAQVFKAYDNGRGYYTVGGHLVSFNRRIYTKAYEPILMTQRVLNGFMAEKLRPDLYTAPITWEEELDKIPNVDVKVYGGNYTWKI